MANSKIAVTVEINAEKIEKLFDALKGLQTYKLAENDDRTLVDTDDVAEVLADYITTYTERKKGKWIYHESVDVFECSVCGRQMVRNIFDYCPWCGAKMEGVQT